MKEKGVVACKRDMSCLYGRKECWIRRRRIWTTAKLTTKQKDNKRGSSRKSKEYQNMPSSCKSLSIRELPEMDSKYMSDS